MSLKHIEAVFLCDGCDRVEFGVLLDPAIMVEDGIFDQQLLYELAEDALADSDYLGPTGPSGKVSLQGGKHLCPSCTKIVDAYGPEDRLLTEDEVEAALNQAFGV
jgi:hypothetical protein